MTTRTPGPTPLSRLAASWRQEAQDFRERYHDDRSARLCEVHASELETAEREVAVEMVTLSEAARVSGYTERHLRALIASGVLANAGRKGAPRLLRSQLPRKVARVPAHALDDVRVPFALPERRKGPKPGTPGRRRRLPP